MMTREYYKFLKPSEEPHLVGGQCKLCSTVYFPPKSICPKCVKEGTIVEKYLSRRGKIFSYTFCTVAPKGIKAPYITAIVEFPEGPRIIGIVAVGKPSPDAVQIDDAVRVIVGKVGVDDEGNNIVNYMFKPIG